MLFRQLFQFVGNVLGNIFLFLVLASMGLLLMLTAVLSHFR